MASSVAVGSRAETRGDPADTPCGTRPPSMTTRTSRLLSLLVVPSLAAAVVLASGAERAAPQILDVTRRALRDAVVGECRAHVIWQRTRRSNGSTPRRLTAFA